MRFKVLKIGEQITLTDGRGQYLVATDELPCAQVGDSVEGQLDGHSWKIVEAAPIVAISSAEYLALKDELKTLAGRIAQLEVMKPSHCNICKSHIAFQGSIR